MTLHFLNDVVNDADSAQKSKIIASLTSETMGKLKNRIPGACLLISNLPGSALRSHVESLGKPRDVNKRFQALPGKLYIKRHSPSILYIYETQTHYLGCYKKYSPITY